MLSYLYAFIFGFILCRYLPDLRRRWFAAFLDYMSKSGSPAMMAIKADLLKELTDRKDGDKLKVLEVGVGTGTNFKFYPEGCHLIAIDWNPHFRSYYDKIRAKFSNIKTENIITGDGENMHMVEDNSVDAVVLSKVLCSTNDPEQFVKEVKRVLVKGGKFYFVEHVREWDIKKHGTIQFLQDLLSHSHIWPFILDGCVLNRVTGDTIRNHFPDVKYKNIYGPYGDSFVFQVANSFIVGSATK